MFKPLFSSFLAALLLVAAGMAQSEKKTAFDKAYLETYIRHLWILLPTDTVAVSDPKPSDVPGMDEVHVKITRGPASGDELLYVTKDGTRILQGMAYDVTANPFKKDLDKLKTSFQPSLGTPGATVVMVLFSDFECPHCKVEANMLRQNLISAFPTQVRLYFIDFPIEQLHPWARPAADAGRCVFHQDAGAFWEYYDWIYAHQESITADNLKSIIDIWAKDRKDINGPQLDACMANKETDKEVGDEIEKAKTMDVTGTPTVFVNGRRVSNSVEWPTLKGMIENEIEYQKTAKNAGEDCGCETKLAVPGLPSTSGSPIKKQ
ncbi:MAG TPA: thioredoxin domain-containing protein [Bryobacteraceae bacterium]|nr:thioredoxin domain-containing protein [Bryobacteraceae bacterium]